MRKEANENRKHEGNRWEKLEDYSTFRVLTQCSRLGTGFLQGEAPYPCYGHDIL
jgi:hypothetical protein